MIDFSPNEYGCITTAKNWFTMPYEIGGLLRYRDYLVNVCKMIVLCKKTWRISLVLIYICSILNNSLSDGVCEYWYIELI